jgi:hypothetical protein
MLKNGVSVMTKLKVDFCAKITSQKSFKADSS